MKFFSDLHIHSKYSRAVSQNMTLEELDRWADIKGILVMATGDFTHPGWVRDIEEKLEPAEPGLYRLKKQYKKETIKGNFADTRFLLTTEISNIYSKGGKVRRMHNIIFSPDLQTTKKINAALNVVGNLKSDGRPILGLDSEVMLKMFLDISPDIAFIPAHIWTPWFSVFGSMSGFDSLKEAFGDYTKHIFAAETGLSSDPPMNWRIEELDDIALISNSDSHSLERIGREANYFDTELSYAGITQAIKNGRHNILRELGSGPRESAFLMTTEFYPEEGKYHYDGHRACGISFSPEETIKHNGICPVCNKHVVVGVMHRAGKLAKRAEGYKDEHRVPYKNLIPLDQIIADILGIGTNTKGVRKEYDCLIKAFGSEFDVLLNASAQQLALATKPEIVNGIERVREGKVTLIPGYDGEYGKIKILENDKNEQEIMEKKKDQASLF